MVILPIDWVEDCPNDLELLERIPDIKFIKIQ
jgi:hypothetical protein